MKKELDDHIKSDNPHPTLPCAVHAQTLVSIKDILGEIKEKITVIDERVFTMWHNGNGHREP